MYLYDDPTCVATLPTPGAAGTPGYFTNGSPAGGQPATILSADFMNMLMEELLNVVTAAGLTPSKTNYTQVLTAIRTLGTAAPAVGTSRNARMYVSSASSSATFTADEVIVETALGGQSTKVASISKTINLATVGLNGMDTGTAPVNSFVGIYLIYNPTTQASALLATNGGALLGNVYGGANMPAGYTASALVSVWPTNTAGQLVLGLQTDREIKVAPVTALYSNIAPGSLTGLGLTSAVPLNANSVSGYFSAASNAGTANFGINVASSTTDIGINSMNGFAGTSNAPAAGNFRLTLVTPQTIFYITAVSSGTPTFIIVVSGYTF
jgi:hypothetical protein